MKRQTTHVTLAVAAVAILIGAMTGISAQQPAAGNNGKPTKPSKSAVQEITLQQYPPDLPPGPHLESFQSHCLLCHTARYVTGQPHFPRAVWEKEVKKMVDVYGAPITPAEQPEIVDYLVAIRGPAASQ